MAEIKIRLTDEEMAAAHEWSQSVPLAALVKHLLIEAIRPYLTPNRGRSGVDLGQAQIGVDLGSIRGQSEPGTKLALSSSQKEKEKRERGPQALPVARRVIAHMNELSGKAFTAETYVESIRKILKAGHTETDLLTVVEWRAFEAQRKGDWAWFKPATLFRPTLFAEKLDEAKNKVDLSGAGRSKPQISIEIPEEDLL